jgi:DNA-binding transcriptional LysR family regulator
MMDKERRDMELRQLIIFRKAATHLSFSRAAVELNYVQSNVTAQIQVLEEELGIRLFDRLGKRVVLTDAGRQLLRYADQILGLVDEAKVAVATGQEPRGTIILAAPETLCTYRLPPLLTHFRKQFPHVQVLFQPTPVSDLQRSVSEGVVDVAFTLDAPLQAADLIIEPLVREPLLVVAPLDHHLVGATKVEPADLRGEPVILVGGCSYRAWFQRTLNAASVYPSINLAMNSVEAIKQCVMVGMGITILPAVTVSAELAEGKLAALNWTEEFVAVTQMLWHKDKWLSPALGTFLEGARVIVSGSGDAPHTNLLSQPTGEQRDHREKPCPPRASSWHGAHPNLY